MLGKLTGSTKHSLAGMCRHEVWVHPSILVSRTIYSWLQIFFYTHFEYFVFKKQSPLLASHLYKNIKSLEIEETKIWSLTSQKFSHFCLMWDFSCLIVQGLLCHIFLFVCLFHNTPEGLLLQLTWLNWCLMYQRPKSSLLGPGLSLPQIISCVSFSPSLSTFLLTVCPVLSNEG